MVLDMLADSVTVSALELYAISLCKITENSSSNSETLFDKDCSSGQSCQVSSGQLLPV